MCWQPGGGGVAAACYGSRTLSLSAEEGRAVGEEEEIPLAGKPKGRRPFSPPTKLLAVFDGGGRR